MAHSLRYHVLYDCDVRQAAAYYERRSPDIAIAFVDAIDDRTANVIASPSHFAIAFDSVRFARVRRYPYLVLFELDDDELRIYGVFHSASDPVKWRDRVDDMTAD